MDFGTDPTALVAEKPECAPGLHAASSRSHRETSVGSDLVYRAAISENDREEIFRLRYDSYLSAGLIEPRPDRRLTDEYDSLPGNVLIGVRRRGELVSTLRLSLLSQDRRNSATYSAFSDILAPILEQGKRIIDGSRLAVKTSLVGRRDLHLRTLRLAVIGADSFAADVGVAAIRPSHLAFYRKFGRFHVAASPRRYVMMRHPQMLVSVDYGCRKTEIARRSTLFDYDAAAFRAIFDPLDRP